MTCQACQDRLIDLVSGETLPDATEVDAHVSGCENCRAELAGLLEAYHFLAMGIDPVSVSPAIKRRLMARIDADLATGSMRLPSASAAIPREHWLSKSFKIFVTSAVAAGVAVVVTHAVMIQRVRSLQRKNDQMYSMLDFANRQNVALQETLGKQGENVKVLQAADLKLVNLAAQADKSGAVCRLFFAGGTDGGFLVVRDAPQPPSGRTYELWFIDGKSNKTAAGTFGVAADGSARVPVKVNPTAASSASVVAVTDEPPGGVAQPTGSIRFVGKLQ